MTWKFYNNSVNKLGFTLAEVLITLVIIGVIAAMTIPTLINKMQDQEMKSQFAKAYSTVSQAIYKTDMIDFGGAANCYYPYDVSTDIVSAGSATKLGDCHAFYENLAANLSVEKICEGNAYTEGCIPLYTSYATASGCSGFNQTKMNTMTNSYILSNGQIIIVYRDAYFYPLFLIDINGHKGPNAYGKDLFSFLIGRDNSSSLFVKSGWCEFPVSGGRSTKEMILFSLGDKK